MKHLCVLLLFSAAAILSAADAQSAAAKPAEAKSATAAAKPADSKSASTAAKPAEAKPTTTAAKPAEDSPVSVLASIYRTKPDPASFADPEKAENLIRRREELIRKIQDERKRILQEDTAAKKLRDEILLLNRKLASLLETKKSMIELNTQLMDIDRAIENLKPAPPPEPETKNADKADNKTDKTDKTDKADKSGKE